MVQSCGCHVSRMPRASPRIPRSIMNIVTTATRPPPAPAYESLWRGRDLLALRATPAAEIREILSLAHQFAYGHGSPDNALAGRTIANLFFEDSTRTRLSFTMAARRLGADVVDLWAVVSSVNKGETLLDSARTVEAMGVDAIVIRARGTGAAALIARELACPVINAGDGGHEHPTQGLLDAYALAESQQRLDGFDLSGLRVAIVGDLTSSRVARSNIACLSTLGAKVVCVGPPALAPASLAVLGCDVASDLDSVLPSVDAVMALRVQFERHGETKPDSKSEAGAKKSAAIASIREYRELYALTAARAAAMKPGAVIMHPGPMNRGIEIDADVADGPRSIVLRQVAAGVVVRMAVLHACLA